MRFSNDFIEEVRARNNIVDIVSGYVKLTRKGSSYMGLCPFHSEKSGSFSVNPARQMYHCFGCGVSGDVFSFLMEYEKNTFQEAVASLAKRAGMELPEDDGTDENREQRTLNEKLLEINKEAAIYFYRNLRSLKGKAAYEYLKGRKLTDETIKNFGLGYSDKTGGALYGYLKEKGFTDALLKESGLFTTDEKGRFRDKFWNRVMYPIMDINKRVIGFGGRVMGDAKPKYLNSPETPLFNKSRNLYALYAAKQSRRKNIILCEGYMDVIQMHQAGFTNAVASLGTALTSQMASLIHRYTKEVLLLYDSDEAGIKAALRAIPILRQAGVSPKVVNLKPYKDPDEFIKAQGAEAFEKRLDNAQNGFMFEIKQLSLTYDLKDPQGTADFRHEVTKRLLTFPDEIERSSYMESVSREYNIGMDVMKRQLGNLAMAGITSAPTPDAQPKKKPVRERRKDGHSIRAQKLLLGWINRDETLAIKVKKYIKPDDFTDPICKRIADELFAQSGSGKFSPVSLLNAFEENEEKAEAASILESSPLPEKESDRNEAVTEVLISIKNDSYKRALEQVQNGDMAGMQKMLDEKKMLEELKTGKTEI